MFKSSKPSAETVIGPYSAWPRRGMSFRGKAIAATSVAVAAGFVHCILPMIA